MNSLKKNRDFRRVYNSGKSLATSHLVLYWYPNQLQENRVGFSISKKIGNAVVRNHLRRRLKEIIRADEQELRQGFDLIFIARKPVVKLEFSQIKNDVSKLLKRAGIRNNK